MGVDGDLVIPVKWESADEGGTENDQFPAEANPFEDFVAIRGVYLQKTSSPLDKNVVISRDASGNMIFKDEAQTEKTLTDLVAGTGGLTEEQHKVLRQLIHFIDDGPAEGFASGAYREIVGGLFPTSIIWWESSSKSKKIIEKVITRSGGSATNLKPTPIVWKVYDTDGISVLAEVSDAVTYSGIFEESRTRTITVY